MKTPEVIARRMDKFITFTIGKLHFKDSAQFLISSLVKLVANLKVKGHKENITKQLFHNTWNCFQRNWGHLPEKAFDMITRKGIYPYEYMDSFDRFTERQLPPQESFYSSLTMKNVKEADYEFAMDMWQMFNMNNLGELHDLYLDTDVVLLADVF